MSNYISSKIKFEELGAMNDKKGEHFLIDGKIYTCDYVNDPSYIDDGVLNLSYYELLDEDGNVSEYIIAFDKIEDVENPQEWSDEYNVANQYVLKFN